jgi:hypothetical protein
MYRSVYDHRTSVIKFIHEQLPIRSRLSKRARNLHEAHCYRCGADSETSLHILVCTSESGGMQSRQSLYSSLRTAHSKTPPSELWDLLLFCLQKFLTNQPILPPQVSESLRPIVRSQNSIGWLHLFQGRWSVEWNASYRAWMSHLPPDDPLRKASTFTVKAGRMLLRQWIRLWKLRNEHRQTQHSPDFVTAHDDQVRNRLRSLYILRPHMRPYDTRIFYPSVDEHLRDDIPAIGSWIIVNQALITHSVAQASGLSRGSQSLITTYFAPPLPSHHHGSLACPSVTSYRVPDPALEFFGRSRPAGSR